MIGNNEPSRIPGFQLISKDTHKTIIYLYKQIGTCDIGASEAAYMIIKDDSTDKNECKATTKVKKRWG